jgi:hypothetical protein
MKELKNIQASLKEDYESANPVRQYWCLTRTFSRKVITCPAVIRDGD